MGAQEEAMSKGWGQLDMARDAILDTILDDFPENEFATANEMRELLKPFVEDLMVHVMAELLVEGVPMGLVQLAQKAKQPEPGDIARGMQDGVERYADNMKEAGFDGDG